MWQDKYLKEALKDLKSLDGSIVKQVLAGIYKVRSNPLPKSEGGYGTPLGNKHNQNLTGFFKIKYKSIGIRVVYTLVPEEKVMNIVVISARDDDFCYDEANKRKQKYGEEVFKDLFSGRK